jgi:hypothetical protein
MTTEQESDNQDFISWIIVVGIIIWLFVDVSAKFAPFRKAIGIVKK